MRLIKNLILILIILCLLTAIFFISIISGDVLLDHLFDALGFKIDYQNHSGFVSAFILKKAILKNPVLRSNEAPVEILCDRATIHFDYSELIRRHAIGLTCDFDKPSIVNREKGDIDFNLSEYIPESLMGFLEQDEGLKLDRLYCKLLMLEDTVEIYDLHAESGEINLMVRGSASQDGAIKIYAKIQFSPDFLADFPEEMTNMLKSEDNGWKSFQINVDNDPEKSSFMIENDLFKLVIGEKEADT